MDTQTENEFLLFRNRIRRFTEKLLQDETKVYKDLGIKVPLRWMRVMHILDVTKIPMSITEVAIALNRTHPDIHHITVQMHQEGLIKNKKDRKDQRRRLILLTEKGDELVSRLKPIWIATEEATAKWIFDLAPEFLIYLRSLENSLSEQTYYNRIVDRIKENSSEKITIKTFKKLASEEKMIQRFYKEWEDNFHPVEELSVIINNISRSIITKGGQVLFAYDQENCVGISVLQRLSFDNLQLLFIYVIPTARRKYIANKLLAESIKFAKDIGCKQIIAHIHRILVPVDNLLRRYQFELSRKMNKNYPTFQNLPHTMILKNIK